AFVERARQWFVDEPVLLPLDEHPTTMSEARVSIFMRASALCLPELVGARGGTVHGCTLLHMAAPADWCTVRRAWRLQAVRGCR
ncbi:MAG TPA: hypothetical protein VGL86_15850, partial [Polyangia bacterium]